MSLTYPHLITTLLIASPSQFRVRLLLRDQSATLQHAHHSDAACNVPTGHCPHLRAATSARGAALRTADGIAFEQRLLGGSLARVRLQDNHPADADRTAGQRVHGDNNQPIDAVAEPTAVALLGRQTKSRWFSVDAWPRRTREHAA